MGRAVESADQAIAIKPSNAQAHLWRADALRQLAAAEQGQDACSISLYADARDRTIATFLDLTNFSTGLGSKLAFHFIGLGVGSRRHADRQGAYDSLRSAGLSRPVPVGAEGRQSAQGARLLPARAGHAPNDPIAYFLLGNVNRDLFNARQSCGYLKDARTSYAKMLEINPHLDESKNARTTSARSTASCRSSAAAANPARSA